MQRRAASRVQEPSLSVPPQRPPSAPSQFLGIPGLPFAKKPTAMNIETKIYAAGGILVVLLGGLWMVNKSAKEEAASHSSVAAAAALPEIKLAADDADK